MSNDDKLKALGSTAYWVPEEANTMVEKLASAQKVLEAAFDVSKTGLPMDFEGMFENVEFLIEEFIKEVDSDYDHLEEQLEEVVEMLGDVAEDVTEGSGRIQLELGNLTREVEEFSTVISGEAERVTTSLQSLARVHEETDAQISSRLPSLEQEFEGMYAEYGEVDQKLEAFEQQIAEKASEFGYAAMDLKPTLDIDIVNHGLLLKAPNESAVEDVAAAYEESAGKMIEYAEQNRAKLEEELTTKLKEVLSTTHERFDTLKSTVDTLCDETSEVRQWAQPRLEELKELVAEIEERARTMQDLARDFGGSF